MLIYARQHVEEHGGNPSDLSLWGQDNEGSAWVMCQMNLILHGVMRNFKIANDDVLAAPEHQENGEIMRFDRVLSNPPFSMNYEKAQLTHTDRFSRYGYAPETGKKADLMFALHMLASLRKGGIMATVMPHGVLFRGGKEMEIRKKLLEDDAEQLFFGTSIPACILVMRRKGEKPEERRGKVLFINADREYEAGRAQNYLRAEHAEKIVATFQRFEAIERYSAVVTLVQIQAEGWNLNIRRYADNSPPPEPQDVKAHLVGGVPKLEVKALAPLAAAHGFKPACLFVERDAEYLNFGPGFGTKAKIRQAIEEDAGVHAKEQKLLAAFGAWWDRHVGELARLPETRNPMALRRDYIESFAEELAPANLLDRFKDTGALVTWWYDSKDEIKTISELGFPEVIDGWIDTIRDVVEDEEAAKNDALDPFEHKLVKRLLPEYLAEIESCRAEIARCEGERVAFEQTGDDEYGGEEEEGEERNYAAELKAELKTLLIQRGPPVRGRPAGRGAKKAAAVDSGGGDGAPPSSEVLRQIAEIEAKLEPHNRILDRLRGEKRRLKELSANLLVELQAKRAGLSGDECRDLVLELVKADLEGLLRQYIDQHRQEVIVAFENLMEKYGLPLDVLEKGFEDVRGALQCSMKTLYLGDAAE